MAEKYPIDIIIPVFNEGESIINVLELLEEKVTTKFRVLICYDFDEDTSIPVVREKNFTFPISFVKNKSSGPHSAVISGFEASNSECVIVFPGDDISNQGILDEMYAAFKAGNEVVVASRFMKGGSMIGCPLVKSIFVRAASYTLFYLSSIPVRDASNGFRLFSTKVLENIEIESSEGFTYSLELLVKCQRLGWKIGEIPASWIERTEGKSSFKLFYWIPKYLKWYFFGLATYWLKRRAETVKLKK